MEARLIPSVRQTAGALVYDEHGKPTWRYRVEPFREAIDRSGMSMSDVARLAGFRDTSYVSRLLGHRPWGSGRKGTDGKRYFYTVTTLSYENAVRLARALHLDFTEWEL